MTFFLQIKMRLVKWNNSSVLWQKSESQNGANKNTKPANFPKNERFSPPGTYTYVCVSGGKKTFVFRKIWRALYSCYLRFEIRLFAIVLTNYVLIQVFVLLENTSSGWFFLRWFKHDISMVSRNKQIGCFTHKPIRV